MLRKISRAIGFTETEIKVILFLIVIFIVGYSSIHFFREPESERQFSFDYTKQDSLFLSIDPDSVLAEEEIDIDYKQEVLDFNKRDYFKEKPPLPAEGSIELNSATLNELVRLPGIGDVTAERIIQLREKRGSFKKLKELLDVKGIGTVKFNKIKKFLYIR